MCTTAASVFIRGCPLLGGWLVERPLPRIFTFRLFRLSVCLSAVTRSPLPPSLPFMTFPDRRSSLIQVLPTLKFCAERDETVAIQLCVLGCYDAIAKRLEKLGPVATHILPACTPMLACRGLNSNQFEMAVGIVQGMLETVVAYRRKQIANPSATAIIENRPTHAGGEPDEAEITRQRVLALGGWKAGAPAAPYSGSKAPASAASLSPVSAAFPGAAKSSSPAPTAAGSSSGFDVFSAPSLSAGSPGAQAPAFSGNMSPLSNSAIPVAGAGLGGSNGSGPSSSSAANMFQGLSVSQKGPATNGTSGGSSGPFASAGLGDMCQTGAHQGQGANSVAPAGGGMSWTDGAFGGGGGNGGGSSSSSGGANSNQAPGTRSSSGMGSGFSGLGMTPGGLPPPPQPAAAYCVSSPPASGASGDDPFAAFFDAAIAGGSGAANSPQMAASASPGGVPAASAAGGAPPAFMGGFGAGPVAAGGGGGTGTGGSLEDQLAKTQREIAQLTRELGGAGSGMMAGLAAGGAMAAAMGGAGASAGGTGMPGWPGGGGGVPGQQAPPQQGQGGSSNDPFAFWGGNQQGGQQGGAGPDGSGFDFNFF